MKRYIKADEQHRLIDIDNFDEILDMANRLNIDVSTLFSDPDLRQYIAQSAKSRDLLELYAHDPDKDVRLAVALNQNVPDSVLAELADDPKYLIRGRVARNKNASADTLRNLYQNLPDNDFTIPASIANNKNTPTDILEDLAHYPDYYVRQVVACNPTTPDSALEMLLEDENDIVSEAARRTLISKGYDL